MLRKRDPVNLLAALTASVLEVDPAFRRRFAADLIERSGLEPADLETLLSVLGTAFSETLEQRAETKLNQRHCSFCHRRQDVVRVLVAATQAAICDECVAVASDTVAENREEVPRNFFEGG